jgi:SAM-dependent methyltransferase
VSNFGTNYSDYYDIIHNEKNYKQEVQQIINVAEITPQKHKRILDFGCGTGLHIKEFLELGYDVYGFDISSSMLVKARINNGDREIFTNDLSVFPEKFDLTYSLFDVISYQDNLDSAKKFLKSIIEKTKNAGLILIDGWHANGAKLDPPKSVERSFTVNGKTLKRIVRPLSSEIENLYPLQIDIEDSMGNYSQEIHKLRAFSESEIRDLLLEFGCTNIQFSDGKDYLSPLKSNSFRFFVKANIGETLI